MGYSIAAREAILNEVFRGTAATWPATYYVALLTTNPSDDAGTGLVESTTAVWTNYARASIANATGSWAAPAGGTTSPQTVSNAVAISFGTATTTANETISGFAIYDAATAGNLKFWGAFGTPPVVQNGDPVSFAIGALVVNC